MMGEGELDNFILKDLAPENYDYILRPIKFKELREKVNGILDQNAPGKKLLSFGSLKIDTKQQLLIFKDKLLQLNNVELDIILLLAQRGGEVIHPRKIMKLLEINGRNPNLSVFYYVSVLRKKLKKYGNEAFDISFIKDQGYTLNY
jgi:two-component system response regulator CpxR